jgi:hypothetical protein
MRSYISEYPGWFLTNQHNLNCIYFLNELEKIMNNKSLYQRLGGYDGITAFTNDLLPRLQADPQLGRFWQNRGDDGIEREHQLLIDYLCASAGGPLRQNSCRLKFLEKIKFEISDEKIYKVF